MEERIEYNEVSLDPLAQKVLLTLGNEITATVPEIICKEASIHGENIEQRVHYRIEKLRDADLVRQVDIRANRGARKDSPVYALTNGGHTFIDAHREELAQPKSWDEAVRLVTEAYREADSALSAARTNSSNLSRLRSKNKELQEEMSVIKELEVLTERDMLMHLDKVTGQIRSDIDAETSRLEAKIGPLDELNGDAANLVAYLRALADVIENHAGAINEQAEHIDEVYNELADAVEENAERIDGLDAQLAEQEAGWLYRIRRKIWNVLPEALNPEFR